MRRYLNKQKHTIHRNVKPSNVLLNSQGHVEIADFSHCASSVTTYGVNRDSTGQTMYYVVLHAPIWKENCDNLQVLLARARQRRPLQVLPLFATSPPNSLQHLTGPTLTYGRLAWYIRLHHHTAPTRHRTLADIV